MKKFPLLVFAAIAAAFLIACGPPPANNTPTNTNTAKPTASAPTADALVALDKGANEAYFKGDSKFFETFLSDKFGWSEKGKHKGKADVLKEIADVKCDMKGAFKLEDAQMSKIDDDTYALSYKGTFDGTCAENGKSQKVPSPIRAGTVFVRNGDKWQAAWHSETPMAEPKADAKDAKKDDSKTTDTKKEEPKKEEPKKDDAKKEEPKKDDAKKDDKAASTAPAAEAKPDANTDALVKTELGGWKAWRDKDAKALDDLAAKNLAFIEPDGTFMANRADVLKKWDTTSGCENVKNVDVKDGFAWALSPTVEVLTFEATADGTCNGQKNGPMDGTSVYVKEGDNWKIAFGMVQPKGKM